jgi:hypothetical protein
MTGIRHSLAPLLLASVLCVTREARAYRPFDGTDADVADVGTFELELGPAHFYRLAGRNYVVAPATVLNLGFAGDFEAVVEFKDFVALRRVPDESRVRLLDTDALLKWVLRRGTLQERSGPSIALETGPLWPELGGDHGFGFQAALIASQRFRLVSVHVNAEAARSRLGNLELFSSIIVEGPHDLAVRPVAEIFAQREYGVASAYSALLGAIWSVSDALSLDLGLRTAREDDHSALEIRLGLTSTWPLWSAPAENEGVILPVRHSGQEPYVIR